MPAFAPPLAHLRDEAPTGLEGVQWSSNSGTKRFVMHRDCDPRKAVFFYKSSPRHSSAALFGKDSHLACTRKALVKVQEQALPVPVLVPAPEQHCLLASVSALHAGVPSVWWPFLPTLHLHQAINLSYGVSAQGGKVVSHLACT